MSTLRVWHIPQVPGEPFQIEVACVEEAKFILKTLALYDLFQLEHNIKPDFSNAQGLEELRDGEWVDWEDEEGNSISDLMD